MIFHNANPKVMGMIAKVRVSLTMVAPFRALAPGCISSQAQAAAVTEEVSFTAVPANKAKPSNERRAWGSSWETLTVFPKKIA